MVKRMWPVALTAALTFSICSLASAQDAKPENTAPSGRAYPDAAFAFAIKDYPAARSMYGDECETGNLKSCMAAADAWRIGRGGPQDYNKVEYYAMRACDNREADGCTLVAGLKFEGRKTGTPDYERARALYARACNLGDARGCAGLGNMEFIALGGPRNRLRGGENLRKACRQDYDWACERMVKYGLPR